MKTIVRFASSWLALAAFVCSGCSKKAEAGNATASAAPEPPACTPEHLKIEKHKFCIKLGPEWQYDAEGERETDGTTEVRLKVDKPPYDSLYVKVATNVEMVDANSIKNTVGKGTGDQITSGSFLDGNGHWVLSKSEGGKISTYSVYVKGAGNRVYICGASGPTPPSGTPAGLEQCKTIIPLS